MANIKPLGNRILVAPTLSSGTTKGGIALPDNVLERPQEGTVVAVGGGRVLDNGTTVPLEVTEGDIVLYPKYGGHEIKVDGKEYLILEESQVLAVKR